MPVLQEVADVADMSSPRFLVSRCCRPARYVFQIKAPNARTRQVNLNKYLYQFSQSGFQPIENYVGHNEDRLVEVISTATPTKNNVLLIYGPESIQEKFVCRLTMILRFNKAFLHFLWDMICRQVIDRRTVCFSNF